MLGRFATADAVLAGARFLVARGYRRFDAHTPIPLDGLHAIIPRRTWPIPVAALAGGTAGALAALAIQVHANTDYPINIGGRALLAWPAFSLPALQFGVLGAVLAVVLALLWRAGLPRLSHPLFAVPEFADATGDGFFLWIPADDPLFTPDRARKALQDAGAQLVRQVPV